MDTKAPTLVSYWNCLRDNAHYHFIDNIGSWLSYVATLELVESFSQGSGLALSAVILIRFFPSLLLSPLAGVLADRCNRVLILVIAAIADSLIVAALILVQNPSQTPLLFALLTAQFTAIALQDPARRAILPVLVSESELHLATTLETFSWSLTGAVGAAVGGAIASRLGNAACFLIDAVTYLLAAWFAFKVPRTLGDPHAMERARLRKVRSSNSHEADDDVAVELAQIHLKTEDGDVVEGGNDVHLHPAEHRRVHHEAPAARAEHELPADLEDIPLLGNTKHNLSNGTTAGNVPPLNAAQSMADAVWQAALNGWSAAVEGWQYLLASENRDVAILVLMKGCGSLSWGAVDVLNVKFSELPNMQIKDGATTLGLIFATVGIGCFLGPIVLNAVVPPHPKPLLWACAAAFGFLFVGAALMAMARRLTAVLVATLVRAVGSATLWIYSTLLLQLRCPNAILGRVSAAEMAFYTVAEAVSSVYGGAAFDVLKMSLEETTASLAVVAGLVTAGWVYYAWRQGKELEDLESSGGRKEAMAVSEF